MATFTQEEIDYQLAHIDDVQLPHAKSVYYINVVVVVLSTIIRLYGRYARKAGFKWDDYSIVVAALGSVGVSATAFYQMHLGVGKHVIALPPENVTLFVKGIYVFSVCYGVSLGMIKMSILFFYHRVFPTPNFQRWVKLSLVVIGLFSLAIELVFIFECMPIEYFWNRQIPGGKCINFPLFLYISCALHIVTDLWIFLLPLRIVLGLRVSNRKRIALAVVFTIGSGVCVISVVRMFYVRSYTALDTTWESVKLGLLVQLETLGGILAANLPVIYPLFAETLERLSSYSSGLWSSMISGSRHQSTLNDGRRWSNNVSAEEWQELHDGRSKAEIEKSTEISVSEFRADVELQVSPKSVESCHPHQPFGR